MIKSPIAPHGPPICPDSSVAAPSGDDQNVGATFDDFLSDQPSTGMPSGKADDPAANATPVQTGRIRPLGGTDTTDGTPVSPAVDSETAAALLPATVDLRAMINPIAPHGPPLRPELPVRLSPGENPETNGTRNSSLTDQHAYGFATAVVNDAPTEPEALKSGPIRSVHEKGTKSATAASDSPDVAVMAAQMPPTVDLRAPVPGMTLTPDPAGSRLENDDVPWVDSGSKTDSSVAQGGSIRPLNFTDEKRSPIVSSSDLLSTSAATAKETAPLPLSPTTASADTVSAPTGSATTHAEPLSMETDASARSTIGDSRLAASAKATLSAPPVTEAAKIAGSMQDQADPASSSGIVKSQDALNEEVTIEAKAGGTSVAKDLGVVNATETNNKKETPASAPAKRGSPVSVVSTGGGRSADNHDPGSQVLTSVAVAGAAKVDVATQQIATPVMADTSAARQAVKVETLLQNALNVGESVRPDGQGQMEMRVKLDGGAADVTVRMQVVNDRMQVTFQTNSAELNKALAHGWQQFSATASQTSTLKLAEPRFETGGFAAATAGQHDTASFSSNQQNPRQQAASTAFADESTSSTASRQTGSTTPGTANAAAGSTGRWSSWA